MQKKCKFLDKKCTKSIDKKAKINYTINIYNCRGML